jgi:signal transduction histidine kinase
VRDEGIGIPESERSQLFDSFYRASNVGTISGTGLGLAIVKRAVDLHGGKIAVESVVGVGTTFIVSLPLNK